MIGLIFAANSKREVSIAQAQTIVQALKSASHGPRRSSPAVANTITDTSVCNGNDAASAKASFPSAAAGNR